MKLKTLKNPQPSTLHPQPSSKGFTLVEALVAVTLLAAAVSGPITIAAAGLRAASIAREQFTATYLAQEAIEMVRQMRDSNVLRETPRAWTVTFDDCLDGDLCILEGTSGRVETETCPSNQCPIIEQDVETGEYGYILINESASTIYTREMRMNITSTPSGNQLDVLSSVRWTGAGGIEKTVRLRDVLTEWQRE